MPAALLNVENPIKEKHISYYTQEVLAGIRESKIGLFEVVEVFYDHPQAPGCALVPRIETRLLASYNRCHPNASPLILMEAMQNTIKMLKIGEKDDQ